jgi:hypothetical protein
LEHIILLFLSIYALEPWWRIYFGSNLNENY